MKNHWLWMLLGCGLPLLLIFFAPMLGISDGLSLFVFVAAMLIIHLFIPMKHDGHGKKTSDKKTNKNKNNIKLNNEI